MAQSHANPTSVSEQFFRSNEAYGDKLLGIRTGGSFQVSSFRFKMDAYRTYIPPGPGFGLGVSLSPKVSARWNIGDGWKSTESALPGSLIINPVETGLDIETYSPHDLLVVNTTASRLNDLLEAYGIQDPEVFNQLANRSNLHDEQVRRLMVGIWRESGCQTNESALLLDGMWQCLVARLLQLGRTKVHAKTYGLTKRQLGRVSDFAIENLSGGLNVADLAKVAGMPAGQFAREFRASSGQSPYQYIMQLRINKACNLLERSDSSLAAIAYQCGFSSQSHMTDVFKSKVGVTPGKYRAQIRM